MNVKAENSNACFNHPLLSARKDTAGLVLAAATEQQNKAAAVTSCMWLCVDVMSAALREMDIGWRYVLTYEQHVLHCSYALVCKP